MFDRSSNFNSVLFLLKNNYDLRQAVRMNAIRSAPVAQLEEQFRPKERVASSTLAGGASQYQYA